MAEGKVPRKDGGDERGERDITRDDEKYLFQTAHAHQFIQSPTHTSLSNYSPPFPPSHLSRLLTYARTHSLPHPTHAHTQKLTHSLAGIHDDSSRFECTVDIGKPRLTRLISRQ